MNRGRRTQSRRRFAFAAASLVLGATALVFHRVVFAGEWLGARDAIRVSAPLAHFFRESIARGEFPEWYPFDGLGQPFVGMLLSGVFHPARLIDLALPVPHSLSVNALLLYPLAALGMYLCARNLLRVGRHAALFAAFTFAFCGYLVGMSNTLPYLTSAATFPLSLWATARFARERTPGALLLASFIAASILFTGDTLGFAMCLIAAGVVIAACTTGRPPAQRSATFAVMIVATLAIAAPQLLPGFGLLGQRESLLAADVAQRFSLYPPRLIELLWGPVFASPTTGFVPQSLAIRLEPVGRSLWTDSIAMAPIGFAFAATSLLAIRRELKARVLAGIALLLVLLAFGRFTPLYEAFFKSVPLWRTFRYPEKLVPWFLLLATLGAAWAFHRARRDVRLRKAAVLILFVTAGISLVAGLLELGAGVWTLTLSTLGVSDARAATALSNNFLRLVLGAAAISAAAAVTLQRLSRARAAWMLCLLQLLGLVWMHSSVPQTVDLPLFTTPTPFTQELLNRGVTLGTTRVEASVQFHSLPDLPQLSTRERLAAASFAALVPDTQAIFGIETSAAYLPAASSRVSRLQQDAGAWSDRFAPLLGTRFQCVEQGEAAKLSADGRFRPVARLPEWGLLLVERLDARPRVYLARPVCVADVEAASAAVSSAQTVVECGEWRPATSAESVDALGTAEISTYESDRVMVKTDVKDSAVLVLNDAYYPGWEASVDGAQVEIMPANVAARAVALSPGQHTVTFEYRQRGLRPGLLIAGVTLFALCVAAAFRSRRVRR